VVTSRGNPVTLLGPDVKVGDVAPEFRAVDGAFQPVEFGSFRGKPILIAAVPSLDTGLCSLETKRFNEEAAKLPSDAQIITISMDLPFAQKRFCEAEHVDRVKVLSDHVWREFGMRYGVLTEDKALLARSIFVVGRDGRIVYRELVYDQGTPPNYDAALQAVRRAAS
jgi:thiol peroxidase